MSITELQKAINKAQNICVFTGAGISCPSGIPDFRSADGLYNESDKSGYSPEEIISHTFFKRHTALFYEFYKSKMMYPAAKPNTAHIFFAELERCGKNVTVVTQNIDGLHSAAGSSIVYELHGSVHRNYCMNCGKFFDGDYIYKSMGVPVCDGCGGTVKPDVVLYEEGLDDETVTGAVKAIRNADLLIIIGTSLAVYPAASFLQYFRGETIALINKSSTPFDSKADIVIYDDVAKITEHLVV
ncbi:MAG: NAD-dependent protein deacylase [Clostridia bacterium]|nr:NAD-dependent protein deacylase [Clostridia bacterium]